MAYIKTDWENLPSTDTPITDAALDNMENGIEYNDQRLNGTKPMGSIVVDDVNCKNMYGPVITGIIMNNSGVETANSDWQSTLYIEVNSSTQYCYSYTTNNPQSVMGLVTEYDSSKTFIRQTVVNTTPQTITTTSTTKYVRLSNRVDINMTNIQFELGSTATTYTPYKAFENQEIYSLGERKIGTWIDGKPIYRKVVGIGSLPNNTSKGVEHNISNLGYVVSVSGPVTNGSAYRFINSASTNSSVGIIEGFADATYIYIRDNANLSDYSGYAILEYTKTS